MSPELFVLSLAVGAAAMLRWSFVRLHTERWQIAATIPRRKEDDGRWRGTNLTFYGFFTASSTIASVAMFLVLGGAVGATLEQMLVLFAIVGGCCAPAAKLVARWIEGKQHTFSVAGASFVGVLVAPLAIGLSGRLPGAEPTGALAMLAAIAVAYVLGEGIGRLGCISFGCCYGKPVDQLPRRLRRLFERSAVTFHGPTKKIAYASGLEGVRVVPVQALTSVVYLAIGLAGTLLFLHSLYAIALVAALGLSQLWRALSETLRADHRGGGRLSAYQWMSLATALFAIACAIGLDGATRSADLAAGLRLLWRPDVILILEATWLATFLYTGWSMVTGSLLSFHIHEDRI
jgi:hypothetical protein